MKYSKICSPLVLQYSKIKLDSFFSHQHDAKTRFSFMCAMNTDIKSGFVYNNTRLFIVNQLTRRFVQRLKQRQKGNDTAIPLFFVVSFYFQYLLIQKL